MPKQTTVIKSTSILVIWVAAVIGLLDSIYLSYVKITQTPIYCTPGLGHCETVNASRWSEIWGIPVAIFGIMAYFVVILILILGNHVKWINNYQNFLLFGVSFSGFLFSLYLTYIELFVLHTICQWCILSAISITAILIAVITRLKAKKLVLFQQGGN